MSLGSTTSGMPILQFLREPANLNFRGFHVNGTLTNPVHLIHTYVYV